MLRVCTDSCGGSPALEKTLAAVTVFFTAAAGKKHEKELGSIKLLNFKKGCCAASQTTEHKYIPREM